MSASGWTPPTELPKGGIVKPPSGEIWVPPGTITGGIERLKILMNVIGVSGVGKSSLLNAVEPGLKLTVKPVNVASGRGRHTTSMVTLLGLSFGGYVVDTPGIRQFALWKIERRELAGYFEEFLPYRDMFLNGDDEEMFDIAMSFTGTDVSLTVDANSLLGQVASRTGGPR